MGRATDPRAPMEEDGVCTRACDGYGRDVALRHSGCGLGMGRSPRRSAPLLGVRPTAGNSLKG